MSQAALAEALDDGKAQPASPARFSIHRNNASAALAVRFPVTKRLVGEAFFGAMVRVYAAAHPPSSPVLIDYGGSWPEFIEGFPPALAIAYLGDVARLESAWWRAYHAADARPLDAGAFALAIEALAGSRLGFHPAVAVVASQWPIVSIWQSHKRGGDLGGLGMQRGDIALVSRQGLEVAVDPTPGDDARLLLGLMRGEPLGRAVEATLVEFPEFDLTGGLARLIASGIVCSIVMES